MRRAAGLERHQAPRKLSEKRHHPLSPEPLLDDDPAFGVLAVNLKDALGDIEPDCDSLHDGRSPRWEFSTRSLAQQMPSGAVHPALRAAQRRSNPGERREPDDSWIAASAFGLLAMTTDGVSDACVRSLLHGFEIGAD
jgi:hypothetical protein